MCEPTTLMAISLGATVLGSISERSGLRNQAEATQQSAAFNAQVARNNAIIAERQAEDAIKIGGIEAAQEQLKGRQLVGVQRATLAANGVRLVNEEDDTGAIIQADTLGLARLNADIARDNAQRRALGFRTQAVNFQNQATLITVEGSNTASALNMQSNNAVLAGIGSVASKWYSFGKLT